jgi:hypothetical protein
MKVGDRVVVNPDSGAQRSVLGRVYVVDKVNPRNVRCKAEDGGRGINWPAELLLPATEENIAAQSNSPRPFQPVEFFTLGEIVTLKLPFRDFDTEVPMVVVGGRDKVNVAPLGGANDRYVRVPSSGLVRRDREWLATRLLEEVTA